MPKGVFVLLKYWPLKNLKNVLSKIYKKKKKEFEEYWFFSQKKKLFIIHSSFEKLI